MNQDVIIANAKVVVRAAMSEPDPLPLISAAALAGNGWQENLMQPVTRGPKDHGSDGLLQWRLSRLAELQRRKDWDTLPVQVQFFKDECRRDYPALWRMLANPGGRTLENLVANVCDFYERPSAAGRQLDKRISYARQIYALFDTQPAPAAPKTLPPSLQPVTDPPSSLVGLLAFIFSYFVGNGSQLGHMIGGGPVMWAFIGVVCIFFIDSRRNATSQQKESKMEPIIEIVTILEKVVPLLVKYGPVLETLIVTAEKGGDLPTRLAAIAAELEKLNPPAPPAA